MELHFFPGQHILAIKKNNIFVSRFEAWGGPAAIGADKYMPEEPTWPGTFWPNVSYHTSK